MRNARVDWCQEYSGKPLNSPCEVLFLSKRGHFSLDPLINSTIHDR